MSNLAIKDAYLQSLGKKVCVQHNQEPRKRTFASNRGGSENLNQPKEKKKKKRRKHAPAGKEPQAKTVEDRSSKSAKSKIENREQQPSTAAGKPEPGSFSTVDILRKRLHEKIQEAKGQGSATAVPSEELEKKRLRRKQERERKKRKRKEMRLQKKEETKGGPEESMASNSQESQTKTAKDQDDKFIFSKVEVCGDELSKPVKKKEKKKAIKGNITPMTGKNYKQLLSRLESRKNKIEELKVRDNKKAQELEKKIKWTNVLYKAEGIKIKDNEDMLKAALKRKEKLKAQRQKKWEKRTEKVLEKMQQQQDKRRRNIMKKKRGKMERRKEKVRKKGRVLPEDIDKA